MIRTQIFLEKEQAEALRHTAAHRGMSVSAVIREAVDRHLVALNRREAALAAVGAYGSGHTRTSQRHDEVLFDSTPDDPSDRDFTDRGFDVVGEGG